MIRNRLVYILFLLLGVFFVMAFGGRMPVFLLTALLLLPLVSILAALVSSRHLEMRQTIKRYILQKGEETIYTIKLTNQGHFFCPLVRACFLPDAKPVMEGWNKERFFSLPPKHSESHSYTLKGRFRGKFPVGVEHLEVLDYLGLFRLKRKANQKLVLKVFPQAVPLTGFYADLGQEVSRREMSLLSQEDHGSISDIKNYHPGDHLKDMHWKLSAKRGELLVKNYEVLSNTGATIAIDLTPPALPREKALALEDRIIASAISIEQYLHKKAIPCCLAYADDSLAFYGKGHSLDDLLDQTAFLPFNGQIPAPELLQLISSRSLISSSLLLFCHQVSNELCSEILRLRLNGLHITLFYFASEEGEAASEQLALVYELIERGSACYVIREGDDLKTQIEKK